MIPITSGEPLEADVHANVPGGAARPEDGTYPGEGARPRDGGASDDRARPSDDGARPSVNGVRADGRATRWVDHRASRRAELVDAARHAVHHLGPDVSMDDLAGEIGTSKSILYRYFSDKSGLQTAVGQAVLEGLRTALEEAARSAPQPRERLAAMVAVYLEMVHSSSHVYTFVTRPEAEAAGALRGFVSDVDDMVAESLLPVLRERAVEADDAVHELAIARLWGSGLVGMVRAVAERWFGQAADAAPGSQADGAHPRSAVDAAIGRMDRHDLAEQITEWLWEGAAGVARRARPS